MDFFEDVVVKLPDLVRVVDKKGIFKYLNHSVKNILGYEPDDLIGESMYGYIHERDIAIAKDRLAEAEEGKHIAPFELLWKDVNGNFIPLEALLFSSLDEKGEKLYVFNCRDIRERKNAENELRQTNFELDSFVYRASHDIRAPLTSILGLIDLIEMKPEASSTAEYLALMRRSVARLDKFVSDLNYFSRNSRLPVIPQHINFKKLVESAIDDFKFIPPAKNLDFRVEVEQDSEFLSDELRLRILLNNLISNSIKYQRTQEYPYILIKVNCTPTDATILVKDNGLGIKKEYQDKVFDMFFRATQDASGSGLGLYIVKQVIEKLNGEMLVFDSLYGEGTEITISVPGITA